MKKGRLLIAGGAIAVQLAVGVVVATPAQASVWNCSTGYGPVGPWGRCLNSSSGHYRANLNCRTVWPLLQWTHVATGPSQTVTGKLPSVVPDVVLGRNTMAQSI